MTPELTLVVPTYRRPEKLARALASIPTAVTHSHEVIVIDDCPDGSGFETARRHGARYVHKAGVGRGHSASRNIGLDLARGHRLAFLDDDDFFVEHGLDRLLAAADGFRIVFGDYTTFNTQARSEVELSQVSLDILLVCNQIPMGAYLMDRSVIHRRFDTRLRSHEDWDFLLSHATTSRMRHVPGMVVMIDKSENQTTSTEARRRKLFWLDFLSIYARFPASHLSAQRAQMLQSFGIQIPQDLLGFDDEI